MCLRYPDRVAGYFRSAPRSEGPRLHRRRGAMFGRAGGRGALRVPDRPPRSDRATRRATTSHRKLTCAAIFLVVRINPGRDSEVSARGLCADLSALLRAVGFRDLEARLSCVMGLGSDAWDRLFSRPRPRDLHPFKKSTGYITPCPREATSSFIFGPPAWTCVSSSPRRSCSD